MKKTIMLLGILVAALIIIGLIMYVHPSTTTTNTNQTQTSMTNDTTITTPDGLVIKTVTPGTGAVAQSGDSVSVNYTGMFQDGKAFDSNTDASFGHVHTYIYSWSRTGDSRLGQGCYRYEGWRKASSHNSI